MENPKPVLVEQRLNKMREVARKMTLIFAVVLLLTGGFLSIKAEWARSIDVDSVIIPTDDTQYYATSMLNLVAGILYAITAIGLYAMTDWAVKLNVISGAVYVLGTLIVEMIEIDKGNVMESLADVTFWSALPIIQLTLLLVAMGPRGAAAERPLGEHGERKESEKS
ncbi:MAG: hypothetical protein AB1696_25615 [Planctomycetota bacterium]